MGALDRISEAVTGRGPEPPESGPARDPVDVLHEQLGQERLNNEIIQENLRLLEIEMEEEGWRRAGWRMEREFSRRGLDNIIGLSRAYYLSHPLIQRAVNIVTYYTWAQGCEMTAPDKQVQDEVVEPLMGDDYNRVELFSHQAALLTQVDRLVDGNVFISMFTDHEANVSLRAIPADQVREIHTKEGDSRFIKYYMREWMEQVFDEQTGVTKQITRQALYPDWRYYPKQQPAKIGVYEVMWDAPVIHVKTGGLKSMLFGVPETYAALDWARAYKKFLENWHTLVASLSKFAWQVKTKGSKIKRAKEKLRSTIPDSDEARETNDQASGAAFVGKEGDEIAAIPKSGATTSAQDAKPSRLMVASGMNIPDTILSNDPQQGALATAQTLDRPTELYILSEQEAEAQLRRDIVRYNVDAKVRVGLLPGHIEWDSEGNQVIEPSVDPELEVSFPPILEHDQKAVIESIVAAATLMGRSEAGMIPPEKLREMLMEVLGVDDIEQALKEMDEEEQDELKKAVEDMKANMLAMQQAPPPPPGNGGPPPPAPVPAGGGK
jgi:hypothetical protein